MARKENTIWAGLAVGARAKALAGPARPFCPTVDRAFSPPPIKGRTYRSVYTTQGGGPRRKMDFKLPHERLCNVRNLSSYSAHPFYIPPPCLEPPRAGPKAHPPKRWSKFTDARASESPPVPFGAGHIVDANKLGKGTLPCGHGMRLGARKNDPSRIAECAPSACACQKKTSVKSRSAIPLLGLCTLYYTCETLSHWLHGQRPLGAGTLDRVVTGQTSRTRTGPICRQIRSGLVADEEGCPGGSDMHAPLPGGPVLRGASATPCYPPGGAGRGLSPPGGHPARQ